MNDNQNNQNLTIFIINDLRNQCAYFIVNNLTNTIIKSYLKFESFNNSIRIINNEFQNKNLKKAMLISIAKNSSRIKNASIIDFNSYLSCFSLIKSMFDIKIVNCELNIKPKIGDKKYLIILSEDIYIFNETSNLIFLSIGLIKNLFS